MYLHDILHHTEEVMIHEIMTLKYFSL